MGIPASGGSFQYVSVHDMDAVVTQLRANKVKLVSDNAIQVRPGVFALLALDPEGTTWNSCDTRTLPRTDLISSRSNPRRFVCLCLYPAGMRLPTAPCLPVQHGRTERRPLSGQDSRCVCHCYCNEFVLRRSATRFIVWARGSGESAR